MIRHYWYRSVVTGPWLDADKTREVMTQNLCRVCRYCHVDWGNITNGHIAANFVDKPARLIISIFFGFLSDPQSYVNSSQFAAISFKRAYFSVSSSSSRAKSMRQDHSGDGHDTTSSATIASHCIRCQLVQFSHSQHQVQVRAASPPSSSQMTCPGSYLPSWILNFYHLKVHHFHLKIVSDITSISICFIQSSCLFGPSYLENLPQNWFAMESLFWSSI